MVLYAPRHERGTLGYFEYMIACQLSAYTEPVPEGCMGVEERDAEAAKMAAHWKAVHDAGGVSCAWHEIHLWAVARRETHGTRCTICSGFTDRGGIHELCRLRRRDGKPTPRIDLKMECYCAPCVKASKTRSAAPPPEVAKP